MAQYSDSPTATSFPQLLADRFSCRAFLPDPVPMAVLESVLRVAQRTASWCNSQAWQVELTGPQTTQRLTRALLESVSTRDFEGSDIPPPHEYIGEYLQRRRTSGFALYGALGIMRQDKEARNRQALRNYEFFGAPHVAIISSPESLGPYAYVDCGGFVANVLNAAQAAGLGAIAQATVVLRPEAVRSVLPVSETRHLVCGIAIGYPDLAHPANAFRTERADYATVVSVHP